MVTCKTQKFVESLVTTGVVDNSKPIVIFSALWSYFKQNIKLDLSMAVDHLFEGLITSFHRSGIYFPCFANGYGEGICDIRKQKFSTGLLSQKCAIDDRFIFAPSAFFSFAGIGGKSAQIRNLMPEYAWGSGSIYEWFELQEFTILTIGVHPTHNSYFHRLEWLTRKIWCARENKLFQGTWTDGQISLKLKENLFVRPQHPELVNDFTTLYPFMKSTPSYKETCIDNVLVSSISVSDLLKSCLPIVKENPKMILKDAWKFT